LPGFVAFLIVRSSLCHPVAGFLAALPTANTLDKSDKTSHQK
jgi:hypothetical protein